MFRDPKPYTVPTPEEMEQRRLRKYSLVAEKYKDKIEAALQEISDGIALAKITLEDVSATTFYDLMRAIELSGWRTSGEHDLTTKSAYINIQPPNMANLRGADIE